MRRVAALLSMSVVVFAAANVPFAKLEADFRTQRETSLTKPDGWLAVAGLFWLHDGALALGSDPQSDIVLPAGAPRHAGTLLMKTGVVRTGTLWIKSPLITFEPATGVNAQVDGKPAPKSAILKPDTDAHPDVLQFGAVQLNIIKRMDRIGVRM